MGGFSFIYIIQKCQTTSISVYYVKLHFLEFSLPHHNAILNDYSMNSRVDSKINVYYDGTCPMCVAFKNKSEEQTSNKVQFLDVHTEDIPPFLNRDDLLSEMYVVRDNGEILRGSDSIFAVLSKHTHLSWLGYLGSLPLIKQLARPLYRLVADQRHFIFGEASRILWIKVVTIIGLLLGLIISLPLWIGERIIPPAPVFTFTVPEVIPTLLIYFLVANLIWTLLSPRPKLPLLFNVLILVILVLLDQNRLQPWVYQYASILLLLSTFSWNPSAQLEQQKALNLLRIMLAAIYFYSGLQKLNPIFIGSIFPWMLDPYFGSYFYSASVFLGFLVPFIEMFIGIGLLFKKTRVAALVGAATMLVFVLLTLGPLGNNWNIVVWPWNICFFLLALILFFRVDMRFREIFYFPRTVVSYLILFLFAICPILFFFGKWDGYPSFSLYSGQAATFEIIVPAELALPPDLEIHTNQNKSGDLVLDTMQLAMSDIHVPIYPETRVHKVVAKKLCSMLDNDNNIKIEFTPSLAWAHKNNPSIYTCPQLQSEI